MALSERAAEYNDRKFTPETRKVQDDAGLDFHPRLRIGMQAPDFTAYQLDGATVRLSDFRGNKHVAFAFGCLTARSLSTTFRSSIGCIESLPARTFQS